MFSFNFHSNEKSDIPFVFHIGMPKTASTFLQNCIFSRHSEIHNIKKFPKRELKTNQAASVEQIFCDYLYKKSWLSRSNRSLIVEHINQVKESNKLMMLSREGAIGLSMRRHRHAARTMKNFFADSKVLIMVREPLSFVEASYFQTLKGYNLFRRKYLQEFFDSPPCYFDINKLLAVKPEDSGAKHVPFERILNYGEIARLFAKTLGRDQVNIMVYEKLKHHPSEFWDELSAFLRVEREEIHELSQAKQVNCRWTENTIQSLIELQNAPEEIRDQYRNGGTETRLKFLGLEYTNQAVPGRKPVAHINPRFRDLILKHSIKQNKILVEEFGATLEEYGYLTSEIKYTNNHLKNAA